MNLLIFNALSWEQRKLGDISDSYSGGTPTAGKAEYYGGKIPFIRSAEVNSDTTELFLTEEGLKNSSAKMVNKGDILYALYGATSGEVGLARLDGAINQAILDIKPHENFDASFIMQWLRKSKESIIGTYLQGGQGNLSGTIVTSLMVDCPNYAEQQKIGGFFSDLDNLITLHQSKAESWKNKENQLSTISWEQRKVGDITIESTEYTTLDAGYPLLTSSRAGLMYQNEYRGNLTTDSKETLFSVVPIGACTYRHMSDDDVFHLNINTLEKGLVSREYPVFFATKENCLNFIIQYINSSASFRAFCAEQKKGGTRTRLYYNALCEFKMMVPSKREQEVIAGYLLSLDHLITLHQKQWFILKKLQFSPGSNSPVAA